MSNIHFKRMEKEDVPLYLEWAKRDHVKAVWFIDGYEKPEQIYEKIEGNGYDFPYFILLDEQPIGYLVSCDLFAYKNICEKPCGVFTDESPDTFCIDLFIGEEAYLNKGYGTQVVKKFSELLFNDMKAERILIDPSADNLRAIRCYEKAGFTQIRKEHDGVEEVVILEKIKSTR